MPETTRKALCAINLVALGMLASGCSVLSCDDYMTYDQQLESWVGEPLANFEYRLNQRPADSIDRPQNRIEYAYNTPYRSYDGESQYCRTYMEVDRATGTIHSWSYDGEACIYKGFCRDR